MLHAREGLRVWRGRQQKIANLKNINKKEFRIYFVFSKFLEIELRPKKEEGKRLLQGETAKERRNKEISVWKLKIKKIKKQISGIELQHIVQECKKITRI